MSRKKRILVVDLESTSRHNMLAAISGMDMSDLKTVNINNPLDDNHFHVITGDDIDFSHIQLLPPKKEKYWVKFNNCYKNKRI